MYTKTNLTGGKTYSGYTFKNPHTFEYDEINGAMLARKEKVLRLYQQHQLKQSSYGESQASPVPVGASSHRASTSSLYSGPFAKPKSSKRLLLNINS